MATENDNVMTKTQWARSMGWKSAGMAHQAVKEGRVVFAADGVHLLAAESKTRYEATADPAHSGVAERHADQRARPASPSPGEMTGAEIAAEAVTHDYQAAKARREHWAAEREEMNARRESGDLIELTTHVSAFAAAGAQIRATLEAWPVTVAPLLAGKDEATARRILAENVEQVLNELKAKLNAQARQAEREERSA